MKTIEFADKGPSEIPDWAIRQRYLIDTMNQAAPIYQQRYTNDDGTFVWRENWPGMDGSDDGYESYHNWPLFYALGGSEHVHEQSRFLWNSVTKQFTDYGQIYREFDGYYDWMHHGESSLYIYYFGLANPSVNRDRARAIRFAGFYMNENLALSHPELSHSVENKKNLNHPTLSNWDPAKKMIRSPINGSKGPRFINTKEDWCTHRWILSKYITPYQDLDIPTTLLPMPDGEMVYKADWNNDKVFGTILEALNQRTMMCDVPLNLTATSLITNAYLYTNESKYKSWVLDYVEAWSDKIKLNGGICPDNIGPNGIIGETMNGKWWGGYYGWRWPHGLNTIIEPLTIAAMNAVLLTGDYNYLDIPRGQLLKLMDLGRTENGQLLVPHRYTDEGWTSFKPLAPKHIAHIWYMSMNQKDYELMNQFPDSKSTWHQVQPGRGKGDDIHFGPWFCYIDKRNPNYPNLILQEQLSEVFRRMEKIRNDTGDPEEWDVHHWQNVNPIHTEGLLQLTCGGPQVIYHGGLLHIRLRFFDLTQNRPGLPYDVAALVSDLESSSTTLELVNTSSVVEKTLIMQAGAFGEHKFTDIQDLDLSNNTYSVNSKEVKIILKPGRTVRLKLGYKRYCNNPSYDQPLNC